MYIWVSGRTARSSVSYTAHKPRSALKTDAYTSIISQAVGVEEDSESQSRAADSNLPLRTWAGTGQGDKGWP